MSQSLAVVDAMVAGDRPATIVAVNPEKVMKARQDAALRRFLWSSGLLILDGIGVVYAVRLLEKQRIERVPGSELMPAICASAAERGYTVFLFGADEAVNRRAAENLAQAYPALRIVGRHHGFVDDAAMPRIIEQINACKPDVLFVALGSPNQELWLEKYLPELKVKVCQGVGGTFDVIAGKVKRAPLFFRRHNLEWFYRLVKEPRHAAGGSAGLPLSSGAPQAHGCSSASRRLAARYAVPVGAVGVSVEEANCLVHRLRHWEHFRELEWRACRF